MVPFTLELEDVLALQDDVMARLGQRPMPVLGGGLSLLEAALVRPQQAAFYSGVDLFQQATLLAVGVSLAHAFLDGNKRTATAVMVVFLAQAGLTVREGVEMDFAHRLEKAMEASGEGHEIATHELAIWLKSVCDSIHE